MPKLTYQISAQRSAIELAREQDPDSANKLLYRDEKPLRRVTCGAIPLPKYVADTFWEQPFGLVRAALLTRQLCDGPTPLHALGAPKHKSQSFVAGPYFMRIGGDQEAQRIGRERIYARWASDNGWAPRVLPTPGIEGVLVSDYVRARPPSCAQLRDPAARKQVVNFLSRLHAAKPLFQMQVALDPFGLASFSALERRRFVIACEPLCPLEEIQTRIAKLMPSLREWPNQHVFCFFSIRRTSIRFVKEQVQFLGWSEARFAQPLRDLASFFVHSKSAAEDAYTFLSLYFRGPPTMEASRCFAHWALVLALDEHCRLVLSPTARDAQLRRNKAYIVELERLVSFATPIRWKQPKWLWKWTKT